MSVFIPTTLLSLYRGTPTTDEYGDPVDDNQTIITANLPALITERSQRTFLPAEQRLGVINSYIIRLRPGVDVREEDRLRDQTTDSWYQVQEVATMPLIIGVPDIRVTAIKVGAPTAPPAIVP